MSLSGGHPTVPDALRWDLPQTLQDEGGWLARPTAEAFAAQAAVGIILDSWPPHPASDVVARFGRAAAGAGR